MSAIEITPQEAADLEVMLSDFSNATALKLPKPAPPRNLGFLDDSPWEAWIKRFDAAPGSWIGQSVSGGEFLAYRLRVEGRDVTLVLFSWSQAGFDCPALVEGHPKTARQAGEMWLGQTSLQEHAPNHPIYEVMLPPSRRPKVLF